MNLWDILILLAVACIIFFALRAYRRDSSCSSGSSCCSGSCAGCSGCSAGTCAHSGTPQDHSHP